MEPGISERAGGETFSRVLRLRAVGLISSGLQMTSRIANDQPTPTLSSSQSPRPEVRLPSDEVETRPFACMQISRGYEHRFQDRSR
jgi:hypothetical protein